MISFCLAVWIYAGISRKKKHLCVDIRCRNPQTRGQVYKGQTGVISCLQHASRQHNSYHSMMYTQHPVTSTKTSQNKIRVWSATSYSFRLYSESRIMSTAKPSGKTSKFIIAASKLQHHITATKLEIFMLPFKQEMHQISNLFRLNKGKVLLAWD